MLPNASSVSVYRSVSLSPLWHLLRAINRAQLSGYTLITVWMSGPRPSSLLLFGIEGKGRILYLVNTVYDVLSTSFIIYTVSYQPSTTKILNMINSCIPVSKLWRSPPSPIPRSPVFYTEYLNDNFPGNQYSESPPPQTYYIYRLMYTYLHDV